MLRLTARKDEQLYTYGEDMKKIFILILIIAAGCTDAQYEKITKLGDPARVTCYSGGEVIYDDYSTGAISNEEGTDGYYFKEKSSGELVEISADCIFRYGERPQVVLNY